MGIDIKKCHCRLLNLLIAIMTDKVAKLFAEHFPFGSGAIVNFVGGGGKTGLILALLEEQPAAAIIYTTTTRIHPPHPTDALAIITGRDPALLKNILERSVRERGERFNRFVVAKEAIRPDLLRGVAPDFAHKLDSKLFPLILNEADGARSMSIKMPRDGEPVLMDGGNLLVPVIGLDCLNQPLGPRTVFRWELAEARCSLKAGALMTPELAASIVLHTEGVCKHWTPGMSIIPFINKADKDADDALARDLAHALMQNGNFPVHKVVWGSLLARKVASVEC